MKRGLISAVAALSLLSGSAAMAASSGASALSLSGARAGASMGDEANALEGAGWIGIAVFAAIVAAVFIVAEEDDNFPSSP